MLYSFLRTGAEATSTLNYGIILSVTSGLKAYTTSFAVFEFRWPFAWCRVNLGKNKYIQTVRQREYVEYIQYSPKQWNEMKMQHCRRKGEGEAIDGVVLYWLCTVFYLLIHCYYWLGNFPRAERRESSVCACVLYMTTLMSPLTIHHLTKKFTELFARAAGVQGVQRHGRYWL